MGNSKNGELNGKNLAKIYSFEPGSLWCSPHHTTLLCASPLDELKADGTTCEKASNEG